MSNLTCMLRASPAEAPKASHMFVEASDEKIAFSRAPIDPDIALRHEEQHAAIV